ncbi:zinc finger protein 608 isoform X2 [Osmerus eperlanus]|uniref:zinc finger protein 608 isoform X2 n=1 Tax=Osmerus eperlanus TaxID=29151 RepID=UPI002E0ED3EA
MNRFLKGKNGPMTDCGELSGCPNATAVSDRLTAFPTVQIRGNFNEESRKFSSKRNKTSKDSETPLLALCGIAEICVGKTTETQGRPGEALEMNSAPGRAVSNLNTSDVTASCAKGKEERKGKNLIRGWKRERDAVRTRKDKQNDGQTSPVFKSIPDRSCPFGSRENPCHCADGGMGDICGLDCRIKSSAIVVRRNDNTGTPAKKPRTEKVDPMFTVPAPPPPGPVGPPGPVSSAPFPPPVVAPGPRKLLVRTRSIGTSTQDGSGSDSDMGGVGPCQPGTSVNLEGIVWHETEEGVLVVNVTWRKRTYVGTLLDCTKHDWAPPRFCESPSSDPETPGGRGRGKRMRLAIPERPCVDPALPKVRGLPHKNRGGGVSGGGAIGGVIHSKGRRGSLNLINNCRTPPFFSVEEAKISPAPLAVGKRKNKPPADLDLSLVTDDNKTGNGKRIRAKSRSAPSTPQGKSDPSFLDPACTSPILIDCPHPNCTKRYKHINGLRYHQTHAHLEVERKPEGEAESEEKDRLSDCEETLNNMTFDLSETNSNSSSSSSSKKPGPLYKVTTVGPPKNRRLVLSSDHSSALTSKTRRTSLVREGLIDDLSNLPIISNMTVVLENCLVAERSSSVEMPKLEAEGLIEKKGLGCDKGKKPNGKVEKCSSKSRTNRPIAPAPAPPKLIAIPNTTYTPPNAAETTPPQQVPPLSAVGAANAKPLPLKPIKPKLGVAVEPALVKAATLVPCRDSRKKEKRRLKEKHSRDLARTPNGDNSFPVKMEDVGNKGTGKEPSGSLLKEHLSKQEVVNGLTETQESRMASIRAEADKVYTFTDNAPSPSIGCSSRLESGSLVGGDGSTSKTNSPAYSDISDAGDDGGSDCRSKAGSSSSSSSSSSESNTNNVNSSTSKTPPTSSAPPGPGKDPQSPYYHGYDPYYLQGYLQTGQPASSAFHKSSTPHDGKNRKEEVKEGSEERDGPEFPDVKKTEGGSSGLQSQLQLAMSQTQTALAQSLYYGQYARGLYMDQKLLLASRGCDQQGGKQRGVQASREAEEGKHMSASTSVLAKGSDSVKACCSKPGMSYVEMGERTHTQSGRPVEHQNQARDSNEMKSASAMSQNNQTELDSNVSFSNLSDGPPWSRPGQTQQDQDIQQIPQDLDPAAADLSKDWDSSSQLPVSKMGGDLRKAKTHDPPTSDSEDCDRLDEQEQEPMGVLCEDSQSARVAVSPPTVPQQPYGQYQSSYQYLHLPDSSPSSYRGVSPTLVHNYPGFHYPLYGKTAGTPGRETAGREESEVTQSSRGAGSKQTGEAAALEMLQHQSLQYHGKSPAPGERGSPEGERDTERERNHVPYARHLHTHHHTHLGMSYPLMSGQYDLYQGLSSRSLVPSQQVGGHPSSSENEVKK